MAKRTKKPKTLIWIGIIFLIGVSAFFYLSGYRFNKELKITKTGVVEITSPLEGIVVYIDNAKEKTTSKSDDKITLSNLKPGLHSILLSKEGYWPWKKDITILSGAKLKLNPFLVSKTVTGSAITGADPEYDSITEMIRKNTFSKDSKLVSSDNLISISFEEGAIWAEWLGSKESIPYYFCSDTTVKNCDDKLKVLSSKDKIKNIDFYKDRSDLLLITIGESISVLEIDPKGTQNFQPIYKGKEPSFVKNPSSDSILVSDGVSLMEINL